MDDVFLIASKFFAMGIPILFAVVVHETAHGWMAYKLGDMTAKKMGRVTLNPIPHIDLIGTIILPLALIISQAGFLFGWAKPVPFNPFNFHQHVNRRIGTVYVALAGPVSNFMFAFVFAFCLAFSIRFLEISIVNDFFAYAILINGLLGVFNLIPIPPLDGSKILMGLLPPKFDQYLIKFERWGFFILIGIMLIGGFGFVWPIIKVLIQVLCYLPELTFGVDLGGLYKML